jgi:hypothetical protein
MKQGVMPVGSTGPHHAADGPPRGKHPTGDHDHQVAKHRLGHFDGEDWQQRQKTCSHIPGGEPPPSRRLTTLQGERLSPPLTKTRRTQKVRKSNLERSKKMSFYGVEDLKQIKAQPKRRKAS